MPTSYEYNILMNEISRLKSQVQCLKNAIDTCCNADTPPACNELVITTQPQSVSAVTGNSFNLSVVVTGDAPITYQWKKDGVNITGATSSTYSISDASGGDVGIYTVLITNPCGNITSNQATITVTTPVVTFTAHWGWTDAPITTTDDIDTLQGTGEFASGATIIADFRSNASPKYLIMTEPSTEPLKTKWYGTDLNNGNIGTSDDLFPAPVIIGSNRVYTTAYPTQQQDTVIQFKIV